MSGEAFYLRVTGYPWFAVADLADQLAAPEDDAPEHAPEQTIAGQLDQLGFPGLAGEHRELLARMHRMAAVYRVLCWWLAGDTGREQTVVELRQLGGYRPDGTEPGPFGRVETLTAHERLCPTRYDIPGVISFLCTLPLDHEGSHRGAREAGPSISVTP